MKRFALSLFSIATLCLILYGQSTKTYKGYAWNGEKNGVKVEDANTKIEAILTLDNKGIIVDSEFNYLVKQGNNWVKRNDNTVKNLKVDFNKTPKNITPGKDDGVSMFSYEILSPLGLYGVSVSAKNEVAFFFLEPNTRYQFEIKLPANFNYNTQIKDITLKSGLVFATRYNSGGYLSPKSLSEIEGYSVFALNQFSYTIFKRSVFDGLSSTSTVKDLLTRAGVQFDGNKPKQMAVAYGFTGNGGWYGNYKAISTYLKGKDANKLKTLIDWNKTSYVSKKKFKDGVDKDNFFGGVTGATRSIQDSYNGISGATVRMSRENEAYQRALVEAKLLKESEVIKGRF